MKTTEEFLSTSFQKRALHTIVFSIIIFNDKKADKAVGAYLPFCKRKTLHIH